MSKNENVKSFHKIKKLYLNVQLNLCIILKLQKITLIIEGNQIPLIIGVKSQKKFKSEQNIF
jgi:hypothetical protein